MTEQIDVEKDGFAEREFAQHLALAGVSSRRVESIAIIGAGTMGTGIAIAAFDAGFHVLLLERTSFKHFLPRSRQDRQCNFPSLRRGWPALLQPGKCHALGRGGADEEIQRRAVLTMVNEAALLLAEGVAQRPDDVDVVLVNGFGFPKQEGGPVRWARKRDRKELEEDIDWLASLSGPGFVRGDLACLWEGED